MAGVHDDDPLTLFGPRAGRRHAHGGRRRGSRSRGMGRTQVLGLPVDGLGLNRRRRLVGNGGDRLHHRRGLVRSARREVDDIAVVGRPIRRRDHEPSGDPRVRRQREAQALAPRARRRRPPGDQPLALPALRTVIGRDQQLHTKRLLAVADQHRRLHRSIQVDHHPGCSGVTPEPQPQDVSRRSRDGGRDADAQRRGQRGRRNPDQPLPPHLSHRPPIESCFITKRAGRG